MKPLSFIEMHHASILIVDDEKNIRRSLEIICTGEGYDVHTAADDAGAIRCLQQNPVDLILLDINLPGKDGLTLLPELKEMRSDVEVIIISGHGTVENAITATRRGAFDFIEKPPDKDKLLVSIKNALKKSALERENLRLRQVVEMRHKMIGESEAIKKVIEQIRRVAPTDGRVLILGESGTGKELVARAIHENSKRADGPFIKVNCAAIPEELIESELFGNVKGAFTGATETRSGKFSLADKGTLFLDEVGDMSLKVQAKVLRALQEGEFEKVGGTTTEKVDVRVLAATNKDLEKEVAAGSFREDLFFRLNVIPIVSPALRERTGDVALLAKHFTQRYCSENGLRQIAISQEAMKALENYSWPGNIRELQNIVERLVIMATGAQVEAEDLPPQFAAPRQALQARFSENLTLKDLKEQIEREYIETVLEQKNWNVSQAAKSLGVDRTNLHKKINLYNLTPKRN